MILTLKLEKQENSLLYERSTQEGYTENFLYQKGVKYMLWMGPIINDFLDHIIIQAAVTGYDLSREEGRYKFYSGEALLQSGRFSAIVEILDVDINTEWTVDYRYKLKSCYKRWFARNSVRFLDGH